MFKQLTTRMRSEQRGFTLIELLIVILILGILAGIALLASGPFRDQAAAACAETNKRIGVLGDAAVDAGVASNIYFEGPDHVVGDPAPGDCQGGIAGGGGSSTTFTASLVETWEGSGGTAGTTVLAVTLNAPPTAGNMLVAIVGSRSQAVATTPDPTAAGWTRQGVAGFISGTGDRRHVAVFTKVAAGSDTFSVSWPNHEGALTAIVREYSRSAGAWANSVNFTATNGVTGATASPFALTGATGFSGSGLQIAGAIGRDGPTAGRAFSGLGSIENEDNGGRSMSTAFATVSGTGPHGTSFSWTGGGSFTVSGFVIVVR